MTNKQHISFPIFDGNKYYIKYKEKENRGEKLNLYERFYIWSIHNRSNVIFFLLTTLLLTFTINQLFNNKQTFMKGGDDNPSPPDNATSNTESTSKLNKLGKGLGKGFKGLGKGLGYVTGITPITKGVRALSNSTSVEARREINYTGVNKFTHFGGLFPIFDTIYDWLWSVLISSKFGIVIAGVLLVYGFGIVFVPILILFLIVKYLLRMYRNKTSAINKDFKPNKKKKV